MVKLTSPNGEISISPEVFSHLAGDAATKCFGVKGMVACGKDGGPWQLLRGDSMTKGVIVRFNDENGVFLELHIGVDNGVNFAAVARSIINEVKYKVEKSTGIPVKAVDVYIDTIIGKAD